MGEMEGRGMLVSQQLVMLVLGGVGDIVIYAGKIEQQILGYLNEDVFYILNQNCQSY